MGYFPNGTSGMDYEAEYCDHCVHQNGPDGKSGCVVWLAHLIKNYEECDNKDSILHLLIPMKADGFNEKCTMFLTKDQVRRQRQQSGQGGLKL